MSNRIGLLTLVLLAPCGSAANAQMSMPGGGRSLGGYGALTSGTYYGGGGGGYIPSGGNGSGFVPYRSGQGGGIGISPIRRQLPQTSLGGRMMSETPIGGASLSSMGERSRGGMSVTSSSPRGLGIPFGYEGDVGTTGMGMTGMGQRRTRRSQRAGLGYPFSMPAPLPGTSSMSMP